MTNAIKQAKEVGLRRKANSPFAKTAPGEHLAF